MKEKKIKTILKPINPLIKLDYEQLDIVLDDSQIIMIIAGAGSGKTTTILAKVLYLIQYKNINPEDILMISFTNETVNDLKKQLQGSLSYPVKIMTFHKLGLEILKREYRSISILTERRTLVAAIIESLYQRDLEFKNKFVHFLNRYERKNDTKISKGMLFLELQKNKKYQSFIRLFLMFWNKWDTLSEIEKETFFLKKKDRIEKEFFNLFQSIEKIYQAYKKKHQLFDFHDMIIEATKILKNKTIVTYQYIFVDEYQDISKDRFLLLKELVKRTNAKLVVVGDDWQSIYRFSGSDNNLFTQFSNLFPESKIKFLTTTYRNSNELVKIAGKFIMKNKNQIKKELKSNKTLENPIVYCYYLKFRFHQTLNKILENLARDNARQSILILGRYQHDIDRLNQNNLLRRVSKNHFCYKHYVKMSIHFLTIHSAKGLGYDQVILINLENGTYGFPSCVKNHKLLKVLEFSKENQIFEERRLFYVALTRTKNRVYLCIPYFHKSKFITELKRLS